jgi:hypothetical protein
LNWLKQSLTTFCKGESNGYATVNQKTQGRKGWDLPSDYRVDVM